MRALLVILAVIVALFAAVAVVGAILPKGHVVSRSAQFEQPLDVVWQVVSNFSASPSWRSELASVQQLPDNNAHPVWRETYRDGSVVTLETVESIPPRRLVRRIIDSDLPFGGSWTIEIAPTNEDCLVTITEYGEVHNPIFRFLGRFIVGHRVAIDRYLRDLGGKFGEEVRLGS